MVFILRVSQGAGLGLLGMKQLECLPGDCNCYVNIKEVMWGFFRMKQHSK